MIYAILIMSLWAAYYYGYRWFSNYALYKQLQEKDQLTTDEKLWMYCYLHNLKIVQIEGDYYIKNWCGQYLDNGRSSLYWWSDTHLYFGTHDSIKAVLATLEYRFSNKNVINANNVSSVSSIVMSKHTPPKQSAEEYLTLKQLVEEETDPKEKELLNKILKRLNK